ncbi:MAG: glutathione S-transferase family protein [Thiogranum sp.]|jgi:glutathione S-transferase|nr:glutathione S-transferase family protein [Thiogranum sp.]
MALFSRKKKGEGSILLKGFPGNLDTCKCLYMAAEKGVRIQTDLLDMTGHEEDGAAFRKLSPFGKVPCLSEGDLVISGAAAILPYIDIRGAGQSLTPRKAARLGEQNFWIEVGQQRLLPFINILLEEQVLKSMSDPGYTADEARIDTAIGEIDLTFLLADQHLQGREYFAGDYSFAEIHWAPYTHFCDTTGHGGLIARRPNLKQWLDRIKARSNGARRTYDALPGLEQIRGKELRFVA